MADSFVSRPPAEIADDFADDARVASWKCNRIFPTSLRQPPPRWNQREFSVERLQVRALGDEHFVPFFARLAGVQAVLRQLARGGERF